MRKRPGRRRESEPIEIREQVYWEPPFFKTYNHVQERYARRVGFQAWGVYTTLKQFAGFKDGRCTVSLARMAIIWGVSKPTVKRAIRKLRDFGLIRVKKNQASSTYTILKIPVPRGVSRGITDDPSERSQMSLQRDQGRSLDQTLFTKPALPNDASVDTSTKRGNSIALKRLKNLEEQVEKLRGEGARLIEQYGGFKGTRHPRVIEITAEIEELKRKRKILAIQLGV